MNNKPRLLALTLCAFLVTAFSAPALAQENLAKFIEYYNGIEVRLQGKSAECGIKDPSRYEATLDRALTKAGLKKDVAGIPTAYLFVWGRAFGPFDQQCAIFMSLRFGTNVAASAVRLDFSLTEDKILLEKLKAVAGVFPAAFYLTSTLFVKLVPSAPDTVDETIGYLVSNFEQARR